LSWQVIPKALSEWVGDPASEKSQRAMKAMLQMKKIDLEKIRQAYDGTHRSRQFSYAPALRIASELFSLAAGCEIGPPAAVHSTIPRTGRYRY
jgi:hypothetical protein